MTLELLWPGKYDADGRRTPIPRHGEVLRPTAVFPGPEPTRLIEGDNLGALAALGETLRGGVSLVYLDPPFATGGRFALQTRVGSAKKGPEIEQFAYDDRFEGGVEGLVRMLDPRLRLIHELLAAEGSLYVHVDPIASHAVKLLLDEIFGAECFQREIIWRIGWVSGFKTRARNWIRNHDVILFYTKDPRAFTFNKLYTPYPAGYRRRDGALPTGRGVPIDDVWNANEAEFALRGRDSLDSIQIKSFSTEKSGYATQKNESLLRRIVAASSCPGDLVLDPFCGSGTTGVAAVELGRRFIGCDLNRAALHVAKKRLLSLSCARGLLLERVESPREAPPLAEAPTSVADEEKTQEGGASTSVAESSRGAAEGAGVPSAFVAEPWRRATERAGARELDVVARWFDGSPALVEVQLRGFAFGPEVVVPPSVAAGAWSDLLDAWWVANDDDPPRIVFHAFRTHRERELSLEARFAVEPGWTLLRVRVTDVLGGEVELVLPRAAVEPT